MTLDEGITLYVQRKQASGMLFAKGQQTYRAFLRRIGNLPLRQIEYHHISQFLDAARSSASAFRRRHSLLRHFFAYWAAHEMMPEVEMPANRPTQRSRFLPYVYTKEELHRLMRLPPSIKARNDKVHPKTLRATLLLLYATGATVGEVIRLNDEDVDLYERCIDFSGGALKARRRIPIGMALVRAARQYTEWKRRTGAKPGIFLSRVDGARITPHSLTRYFERLRRAAGIVGHRDSSQGPCLRDLRTTFAVHQITSWIKKRRNLDVMLPALSAYMGNVGLESTERYLGMTPERFQGALNKLSPQNASTPWREDSSVLEFLTTF